jgi:hypothetical protein
MKTVTMTDLNRSPSRVARLAEREDVYVTERGVPRLRITRVEPRSRIDGLIAAGLLAPAARPGVIPRRSTLSPEDARVAITEWEAERNADY